MGVAYYILLPFSWLLSVFCQFFNSYGIALILFALVVKLILFPLSLKGKRSMIQMNMLSGKMQKLQKQYGKDQQRYQAEVQKLYEKEGVSPMGGCLWSMIPLFILLPLYAIIRQPMKYMMGMTGEQIAAAAKALNWSAEAVRNGWIKEAADFADMGYNQLYLSSLITPDKISAVQSAVGETAREVFSINFQFLGVDLSQIPHLKFWANGLSWGTVGLFLIPVVSAATGILFSIISMRTNQMNNQAQNDQTQKTNRTMMLITPLMSLWIGFSMTAALSIYWIANNVLGLAQEVLSAKLLKKDYEKAAEIAKQREIEEKEEEKRLRREKAEERARQAEEARKNKGKKKKEEDDEPKMTPEQREASRVGIRQYARGRAYDPDRFGGVTPYHEDVAAKQPPEDAQPVPEPSAAEIAAEKAIQAAEERKAAEAEVPVTETPADDSTAGADGDIGPQEEPAPESEAPAEEPGTPDEPKED